MKLKIRRGDPKDLDKIYEMHLKCFSQTDCWYKSAIGNFINDSIVIEIIDELDFGKIIGVLLQGTIIPCDKDEKIIIKDSSIYINENNSYNGIMMICIDPEFRGKNLGKKLIEKHFLDNPNKLLCLNTRKSNVIAQKLYNKMGYIHYGDIENKYFLPDETSHFMVYKNNS
jgi:ribosomal protein S18 acetylase RimI-like enzyme